jgi:two-component system sensor histidine kinase KdpD
MRKESTLSQSKLSRSLLAPREFLASCAALCALTYAGFNLHFNLTTISFLDLLLVVLVALRYGLWQSTTMSVLAAASLDYFFTDPRFHFYIYDPQDWLALATFVLTAFIVSRLSSKEMRNASEAELRRSEMEQLYELSRSSLLLDMRQAPGPQLALLIQRIFCVSTVALFDANMGRLDRVGEWEEDEKDLAKECYIRDTSIEDAQTCTSQRILHIGNQSVGALVLRGQLNPLVVDALAALAAIAMERHQSFEKEDRVEAARQSELLRVAVLDALAHEFKTPLTAVHTASSGLLELGGMTSPQRELVSLIDSESVRMNELCTRLLRTAKLEAKQVGLHTELVNIKELITEMLNSITSGETRNTFQVTIEDTTLALRVDRGLLSMILKQYIDNARKYSTPGTQIDISACKSRNETIVSVHNFGPTIRIEDRERIFDRFYRSKSSKDSVAGTGIGLSVVRSAAEAHHGHVWVVSDDREGTTFFVSLPEGTNIRREQ